MGNMSQFMNYIFFFSETFCVIADAPICFSLVIVCMYVCVCVYFLHIFNGCRSGWFIFFSSGFSPFEWKFITIYWHSAPLTNAIYLRYVWDFHAPNKHFNAHFVKLNVQLDNCVLSWHATWATIILTSYLFQW